VNYIDAHVHVWTDEYAKYPFAAGHDPAAAVPRTFFPEDILGHARPCGVDRVVLVQMSYYHTDNSYMLEVMRQYPGIFAGIGIVDPHGPDPAGHMLDLATQGVRGFRVYGGEGAEDWLDGEGFASMFRAGADKNLAVCPLIDTRALPALERRCKAFPETPVIIDHMCRIGVAPPIEAADIEALCRMAAFPGVKVKVSAFYALGQKEPPYEDLAPLIKRLYEAFGPQRLMWASDCPYQVQGRHSYAASVELVQKRLDFLSDGDREWIMRRTAEEFFFAER
jgi:predicted TIM-barrel fold metal-dependent hydrolase